MGEVGEEMLAVGRPPRNIPAGPTSESGVCFTNPDHGVVFSSSLPEPAEVAGDGHIILSEAMTLDCELAAAPPVGELLGTLVADGVEAVIEKALGGLGALKKQTKAA